MKPEVLILSVITAVLLFLHISTREPYLNFHGRFKPKKHFLFEKCSKCGKRLKHYHWFWGKGDFMACDVDYCGNTTWFCETCNKELSNRENHKMPHGSEDVFEIDSEIKSHSVIKQKYARDWNGSNSQRKENEYDT